MDESKENISSTANRRSNTAARTGDSCNATLDLLDLPQPPVGSTVIFDKSGSVTIINKKSSRGARPPKAPPIYSSNRSLEDSCRFRGDDNDSWNSRISGATPATRAESSSKRKQTTSSGYGQQHRSIVKRSTRSTTARGGVNSDEVSTGSTRVLRSNSATRRINHADTISSSTRRSLSADPAAKRLFGTPLLSQQGERTRSLPTSSSPSWTQKQRLLQQSRSERATSANSNLGYDSSYESAGDSISVATRIDQSQRKRREYSSDSSQLQLPQNNEQPTTNCNYRQPMPVLHTSPENNHSSTPPKQIVIKPQLSSSGKEGSSGRKKRRIVGEGTVCNSPILVGKALRSVAASPGGSEIQMIATALFANGTGVSDEEINKLLTARSAANTKQWELKKKLEAATEKQRKLKEVLSHLLHNKNRLCKASVECEMSLRKDLTRSTHKMQMLSNECSSLKSKIQQMEEAAHTMMDSLKAARSELKVKEDKINTLEAGVAPLKEALALAERKHMEVSLALATADGRSEEAAKQAESWRAEIAVIESRREEAARRTEHAISTSTEKELKELRQECMLLHARMETREEELAALIESENLEHRTGGTNISVIKKELEHLRERAKQAELELAHCITDLERATSERDAASARATEKDKTLGDLMKSIGDIQKLSQAREDEANASRKTAERIVSDLEKQLAEANGEIAILKHDRQSLRDALELARKEMLESGQTIDELRDQLTNQKDVFSSSNLQLQLEQELRARAELKEQEERMERIALSAQMLAMTKEHAQFEAQLKEASDAIDRKWKNTIEEEQQKSIELQSLLLQAKEVITGLEGENSSLKGALTEQKTIPDSKIVEENGRLRGEINVLKERLLESERSALTFGQVGADKVRDLEAQLREGQMERRRMHNIIQELRGNVRVFSRIRPFLPSDDEAGEDQCVIAQSDNELKVVNPIDGKHQTFTFDRVFAASVGQEAIFREVSEFIQSALDGYNVCLFSYGQTGSGKTYSMQGLGNGAMRGIIPRAIEQVARYKQSLERDGWKYEMKVSFLEIYNENIRDLLRNDKDTDLKHEIKVASDRTRYVTDLIVKPLDPADSDAVEDLLALAAKHRSVAATDMNSVSSRSHSVFTLHLSAEHAAQKQSLKGVLNLVDLAGSERLDRSCAVGERAKEAMAINKSLSSLTDVFVAIGKKSSHIPFRNSKLTYLLQPSLSGDGKTLMMANISPTELSLSETLCTLRFAAQVNKCELGKPKRALSELSGDVVTTSTSLRNRVR